jgi:hypothetical protein
MTIIRTLIGSREAKVSGSPRFWGAMLVTLLAATQATGGESADQVQTHPSSKGTIMDSRHAEPQKIQGYAPVNGLKMYYEIEGTGDPLVYIPPVFGFAGLHLFPALVKNHSVITVDLQGNGRTADIPYRPISIEPYATGVVAVLKYLKIPKADFFGESHGANTAVMIAVRYPELVGRVATYGATFGPGQIAKNPETTHYDEPSTAESRNIQFQRENYRTG